MKRLVTAWACALCACIVYAQEDVENDSLDTHVLNEVVVDATMQYATGNVTTYLPSKDVKRTAQNAGDLLAKMAIPQIVVNPQSGDVQTNGGKDVAVYIDYERASQDEKDALNPQDVKRVEYLLFPSDPRFGDDKYVVNILLNHYEYGGYGKATATGNVLSGSGSGQVYVKSSYKRMTYDVSLYDKYTDRGHTGTEQTQVFRLPQEDGTLNELTRTTTLDDSRYQQNYVWGSFRAKYATERMTISNKVNLSATRSPHSDYSGRVVLSASGESPFANGTDSKEFSPYWNGNYYFDFGKKWTLSVQPSFTYTHTVSNCRYTSDDADIVTDATENMTNGRMKVMVYKTFGLHHKLGAFLFGAYVKDNVKYTGSTLASPSFSQYGWTALPEYTYASQRVNVSAAGGAMNEVNAISGIRQSSIVPLMHLDASYAPNERHQFELSTYYNFNPGELAEKTPDVLRVNEYLYQTGNPYLRNRRLFSVNGVYTFLPTNTFSMALFTGWQRDSHTLYPTFTPDAPDGMMLRRIENGKGFSFSYVGTSLSLKLLNRSLVLNTRPRLFYERMSGLYAAKRIYPVVNFSAMYYWKNFYGSLYYVLGCRELLPNDLNATSQRSKDYYRLQLGWSNGQWNVSASAINIFRRNWLETTAWLRSRLFDQTTRTYSANSHQFISITASYTFNFGKTIHHGDELQDTGSSSSSAIMR